MDLDDVLARRDKAHKMVVDLCNGRRDWIMSIPAQPDYDPDLIIGASLNDIPALVQEIRRLRKDSEAWAALAAELVAIMRAEWNDDETVAAGLIRRAKELFNR